MNFKFLVFLSVLVASHATTYQDRLYYRTAPLRFLFNNQESRRPGINWNYQVVNGRPIVSGFPNPHAYVAFGLNPQTGQIEQIQVITQTRPGGPVINIIQNMLHVAGQFFGQLTGAFGNVVGGALQTAGQFGQDIQDVTNPVLSVIGVSQISGEKEPVLQLENFKPSASAIPLAPSRPSTPSTSSFPSLPSVPSIPSIENLLESGKSDISPAFTALDRAIILLQSFKANVETKFQEILETEGGQTVLNKINEDIIKNINKLEELKDKAISEGNNVLQSAQILITTAFDGIETALVDVAGLAGREFIETTKNEINEIFKNAIQIQEMLQMF